LWNAICIFLNYVGNWPHCGICWIIYYILLIRSFKFKTTTLAFAIVVFNSFKMTSRIFHKVCTSVYITFEKTNCSDSKQLKSENLSKNQLSTFFCWKRCSNITDCLRETMKFIYNTNMTQTHIMHNAHWHKFTQKNTLQLSCTFE